MLYQKTTWIDFSDAVLFRGHSTQGVAHVHRTHYLFATYGLSATRRLSSMRATLRRQSQNQKLLMPRPISLHGLRSTHRQRITPRYRSLPANVRLKTLSCRITLQADLSQYVGQRKSNSALADLRRLCTNSHHGSDQTLRRYRTRLRFEIRRTF